MKTRYYSIILIWAALFAGCTPNGLDSQKDGQSLRGVIDSDLAATKAMLLDNPGHAMIAAVVGGKVAGNCSINGIGNKRKIRHRCSMAIALYREYCGLGIGTAMIGYLTELAKQIGYTQIDLEVVAENEQAQALYRKCGFIESGRRANALRFDDGSLHDEILMYKPL